MDLGLFKIKGASCLWYFLKKLFWKFGEIYWKVSLRKLFFYNTSEWLLQKGHVASLKYLLFKNSRIVHGKEFHRKITGTLQLKNHSTSSPRSLLKIYIWQFWNWTNKNTLWLKSNLSEYRYWSKLCPFQNWTDKDSLWLKSNLSRCICMPKLCPAFGGCPQLILFSKIYFIKIVINMLWT